MLTVKIVFSTICHIDDVKSNNVSYTLYFSTYSSIVTEVVKCICPLEFLNNPNYFLYI